ncbi:Serine/threonine-protein kinase [Savitreella phatthalungensis]
MSWNSLTKKLKQTTLDRESSKTITAGSSSNATTNTGSAIGTSTAASSNGTQPVASSTIRPGLLTVNISQAKGLAMPPGYTAPHTPQVNRHARADSTRASRSHAWWLPYLLVECDKNEVLVDALAGGSTLENPRWDYKTIFDISRYTQLTLGIYVRQSPSTQQSSSSSQQHGQSTAHHNTGDICLGTAKIIPTFVDGKLMTEWFALSGGPGQIQVSILYQGNTKGNLTIDAFDLLKVVGKGSFGKVMQVRKKDTNRIYALKTIRKLHIVSRSEVNHTLAERTVLAQINNPFIVPLKFSFQSPEKLYLVLAFVNGGELFHHLQREGRFSVWRSKFYTAELFCALECLHGFNVIYRDLKPENILLDYTGHIALCDFGLCKLNMAATDKTNTFCGTPEYLAPELLLGQGYTKVVDWWTLGVLLYEMLTGLPPFYDENVQEMYRKILEDPLRFPDDVDKDARHLLTGLLTRDPQRRMGAQGPADIKQHPFFADVDWRKLMAKKIQPPFKPSVESAIDTSNFDAEFTSEEPMDSVVADSHLSETVQRKFQDWSYNPTSQMGQSMRPGSLLG